MTWRFDGEWLEVHARALRLAGAGLDRTTASVKSTLSNVGRSSGAARTLAALVDDLFLRAADLDARAAMLATHRALFTGTLPYPTGLTGSAQSDRIETQAAQAAMLQARIDNWSGSDNDPLLDKLITRRDEARDSYYAAVESAYRSSVDNRALAAQLASQGAWAKSMHDEAVTDIANHARTMARFDGFELDHDTFWRVGQAMASGHSPSRAGLPSFLFPAEYADRMQTLDDLRAEASALQNLLASTGDEIRRCETEQYYALGGSREGQRPREFLEIYEDLTAALVREQDLETHLKDVERRASSLEYPAKIDTIVATLMTAPGLTEQQRGELAGTFLAERWPDFNDLSTHPAPYVQDIGLALPVHNSFATSAFFRALGTEQTSLIPAYAQAFEMPDAVLVNYTSAMASASHQLPPAFGADVITSFGTAWQRTDLPYALINAHYYGAIADLFTHPTIDYQFLLSAYDASETTFADYYDGHRIFDFQSDPRSVLLTSLQNRLDFAPASFLTGTRVDRLFDDYYADDGRALAGVLAALGQVEESPEVLHAISAATQAIADQGQPLQDLTAIGSALMVHRHMGAFIPSNTWDDEAGAFVGPLEPEYRHIERTDIGVSQTDLRAFLERVMREPTASAVVLESAASYVHQATSSFASTTDIYRDLDELGLLIGYVADIAGDLAVESGYEHDKSNALKAAIVGSLMKIAITGSFALIPAGSAVVLAGKAIGSGAANFGVGQATDHFFPTDAEVEVYRQRLDQVTAVDLKPLQFAAIASAYDHDPSLFNQSTMPSGLIVDGHLLRPGDQLEYHGTSEEMIAALWDEWLLAGVTADPGQNAALRWANEAIERLYVDANSPLFGPSRPITSN